MVQRINTPYYIAHGCKTIVAQIRHFPSLDTGIRVSDTQTREYVRIQPGESIQITKDHL